jgi:hypothetical protein
MTTRQVVEKTLILAALVLLPVCVPAQSFQLVSQEGFVSASAAASGPGGSNSDSDSTGVSPNGPIDIFTGAGASISEAGASATARLEASFAPQLLTLASALDANGFTTFPDVQLAGGNATTQLLITFQVDAPAILTLNAVTDGVWTGDSGIEPSVALYTATEFLADVFGAGGQVEFQGLLVPGEIYTLSAFALATAGTSEFSSFGSAQGGFTARLSLQGAPVPEPGHATLLLGLSSLGVCLLARRRRLLC